MPPRTQGRTTDDRERYCIASYLETLCEHGLLEFPFEITKGESPDFRVVQGENRVALGIEHTEAGSRQFQEAATHLEKAPAGALLEGTAIRMPGKPLRGRGSVGDEAEQQWLKLVLNAVETKAKKLPTYEPFPKYELLIYDQNEPFVSWNKDLLARLGEAIQDWQEEQPLGRQYNRYSILCDSGLMYDVTGRGVMPSFAG